MVLFAGGLSGKLLLVHGSGDDNVHSQGTELLVNRLVDLGKPFDFIPTRDGPMRSWKGQERPTISILCLRDFWETTSHPVPLHAKAGHRLYTTCDIVIVAFVARAVS